jgi:cytochrome c oxidase subunit 2
MRSAQRILAFLTLALAAGCERPQSALVPRGLQAQAIDRVWTIMVWTCSALYLAVLVALTWAIWRGARQISMDGVRRDDAIARMLLAWVVVIVGFLSWFVTVSYLQDRHLRGSTADLQIRVTAKQWWWQVDYLSPDPTQQFTTANEIHLPLDRATRIELQASDVIHSFWVPALSGKQDLVPGRSNSIWLTPRSAGRYRGQCAEFCGMQHAHMAFDVEVMDPAAFEAWRRAQLAPARTPVSASALSGQRVFERAACATCHTIRGTLAGGRTGPDLTHLASRKWLASGAVRLERQNLIAWIADPQHFKPGSRMPAVRLTPDEMLAVTDYLMGLQ